MHARIFIGGLLDSIQDADIVKLFSSFGKVIDIDRMAYKERRYLKGAKLMRLRYERRIAFVTLDVDQDKAVQRAVRALHGTKWKGSTLRCQIAKPSGIDRIRQEIEEERTNYMDGGSGELPQQEEEEVTGRREVVIKKPFDAAAFVTSRMHSQDNKTYFESDDGDACCIDNVWAEIETPKQHVYNYEQHLARCSSFKEVVDDDDDHHHHDVHVPPKTKDLGVVEAFLKEQSKKRSIEYGNKTQANTVDFFSQEERPASPDIDLSRFDSDDEILIPQVDGAGDDSSSSSSSDDSDCRKENEGDEEEHGSKTSSSSQSSLSEEDDNGPQDTPVEPFNQPDIHELQSLFPNGALFYRRDTNLEQLQARWRVEGERMRRDFKHLKKQAKRSQRIPPSTDYYNNE